MKVYWLFVFNDVKEHHKLYLRGMCLQNNASYEGGRNKVVTLFCQ